MKVKVAANVWAAGVFVCGVAVFAQSTGQQPQPQAKAGSSTGQQVTVTGCVQPEADYRRAKDAGRGGVAGTGVGAGNEFILTQASPSSGRAGESSNPTGTGGTASGSAAYELTGPNEGQLSQYVGRRVEITGRLKPAETDAAGKATGGPTAGQPPAGVDVASKDLKLRELEVVSVREGSGTCSPAK
jgi:hypothetical protein